MLSPQLSLNYDVWGLDAQMWFSFIVMTKTLQLQTWDDNMLAAFSSTQAIRMQPPMDWETCKVIVRRQQQGKTNNVAASEWKAAVTDLKQNVSRLGVSLGRGCSLAILLDGLRGLSYLSLQVDLRHISFPNIPKYYLNILKCFLPPLTGWPTP